MSENNPIIFNEEPNLIRTSSLNPDYIRRNLSSVNTPVKLLFERNSKEMIEGWTQEEKDEQRRLVKFDFVRLSPSDYLVKFKPIKKLEYTNGSVVVSCIFWEEKELYIVTSVDIILLLENLIQESFTIEEKNRVRRNLQSLKPYTISRSNKNYQRFFQLLMSMEDPRPRNIEKDIKVFKWTDLFTALTKVISKYSSNNNVNVKVENDSDGGDDGSNGKFNQALNNNLANFNSMNSMNPMNSFNSMSMNTMNTMNNASHNFNAFDLKADGVNSHTGSQNTTSTLGGNSSTSTEDDAVLHPLKYKPKKKKINRDTTNKDSPQHEEHSSINYKHQAFRDGIKPSNPIPMKSESTQTPSISSKRSFALNSSASEQNQARRPPTEASGQAVTPPNPNLDNMEVDSSDSTSLSNGSSSTYAVSSSDEIEGRSGSSQLKNSNSADGGSIEEDAQSSNENMNVPSYTIPGAASNNNGNNNRIPSRGIISSGSADSNSQSGSDSNAGSGGSGRSGISGGSGGSGGSGLFSNRYTGSDQNTGFTSVGESIGNPPPKSSESKAYNNINNFAQDQSNRIFGSVRQGSFDQSTHQPQYYQYPEASQIHYNNTPMAPSFNGPTANSQKSDVKLPSLEEYFHTTNKHNQPNNGGVKLAPLKNNGPNNHSLVNNPKSLVEYSKEKSTK